MFTIFSVWDNILYEEILGARFTSPARILLCLILSIFTIPIDILLSPLEIISVIIFLLIKNKGKGDG